MLSLSAKLKATALFAFLGALSAPVAFGGLLDSSFGGLSPGPAFLGAPCAISFAFALTVAHARGWLPRPPVIRLLAALLLIAVGYVAVLVAVLGSLSLAGPTRGLESDIVSRSALAVGVWTAGVFAWGAVSLLVPARARQAALVFLIALPLLFGLLLIVPPLLMGTISLLGGRPVPSPLMGRDPLLWTTVLVGNAAFFGAAGRLLGQRVAERLPAPARRPV